MARTDDVGRRAAGELLAEYRDRIVLGRSFWLWQLAVGGIRGEERFRFLLGFGDVRFVERIDSEHGAGHRRREFPAEELRAETVDSRRQTEHRMPGGSEALQTCCGSGSSTSVASATNADRFRTRRASRAVRRRPEAPLPCLPVLSATSCSIHRPSDARRGESTTVSLSRPSLGCGADERAELEPRIRVVLLTASFRHVLPAPAKLADRGADQRRRDESEERQRRKAPADVRRVQENLAVAARLGELLRAPFPGSVIAMKWRPARPPSARRHARPRRSAPSRRLRPCRRSCWRRGRAFARIERAAAVVIVRSSVVSRTTGQDDPSRRRRPTAALRRTDCCRPCRADRRSNALGLARLSDVDHAASCGRIVSRDVQPAEAGRDRLRIGAPAGRPRR